MLHFPFKNAYIRVVVVEWLQEDSYEMQNKGAKGEYAEGSCIMQASIKHSFGAINQEIEKSNMSIEQNYMRECST